MYELKEIPSFEDYFIDNDGNVFSNKLIGKSKIKRNFKQLKTKMCNGYKIIQLHKDKKHKNCFIHRLVALTFIGQPSSPDLVVNHKDGNKLNNTPENLEWVTHRENSQHYWQNLATDRLIKKEENRLKKLKLQEEKELNHKIICIETKQIFKNQIEAATKFNVSKAHIYKCVNFGGKCRNYHLVKYTDYLNFLNNKGKNMKKVLMSIQSEVLATMRQIAREKKITLDEYVNAILKQKWLEHIENKFNELKTKKFTR